MNARRHAKITTGFALVLVGSALVAHAAVRLLTQVPQIKSMEKPAAALEWKP